MINKKNILKLLVSFSHKSNSSYDKKTLHPKREWFIGICLFILIVGVGAFQSVRTFISYKNIQMEVSGESAFVVEYKQNTVQKALGIYTKKKNTFMELQAGTNVTVKPLHEPAVVEVATTTTTTLENNAEPVIEGTVEIAN